LPGLNGGKAAAAVPPPESMAELAPWFVFIEHCDFGVLHRPGARHGNAAGSGKPIESVVARFLVRQGLGDIAAAEPADGADVLDGSAREPPDLPDELLADLQLLDPEIGSVARLRLKQFEKPMSNSYRQSLRLPRCFAVSGSCRGTLVACCTDAGVARVSRCAAVVDAGCASRGLHAASSLRYVRWASQCSTNSG